jgi:serine/threonine protein kinase
VGLAVRSQHIVRVEQCVADGEGLWLVLEWLDGATLERTLADTPQLSPASTVWIARQCAQGLEDLARAGFVHGDVKPANIFVTGAGQAKLIDLGFAWPLRDRQGHCERNLAGTAEYMAPEVLAGDRSQPVAADIYSLGITMFRMLAGRLPFENGTAAGVLKLQRQAKPPDLARVCPQAPAELCALIERMLAKQPVRRPARHADVVRALIELELQLLAQHSAAA